MHRKFPSAIEGVRLPEKKLWHCYCTLLLHRPLFLKGFFCKELFYHKFININIFFTVSSSIFTACCFFIFELFARFTPYSMMKILLVVGWKMLFTNTMKKMRVGYQATWKSAAPIVLSTRHCPIKSVAAYGWEMNCIQIFTFT